MDFQFDATADNQRLKFLNVIDEHSRQCLAIRVGRRCRPRLWWPYLRNSPTSTRARRSSAQKWPRINHPRPAALVQIQQDHNRVHRAGPVESGVNPSTADQDELLNTEPFATVAVAQGLANRWRWGSNIRPHSELRGLLSWLQLNKLPNDYTLSLRLDNEESHQRWSGMCIGLFMGGTSLLRFTQECILEDGGGSGKPVCNARYLQEEIWITSNAKIATTEYCFAQHISDISKNGSTSRRQASYQACQMNLWFGYSMYSVDTEIFIQSGSCFLAQEVAGEFTPENYIWEKDRRFYDALRPALNQPASIPLKKLLNIGKINFSSQSTL